MQQLLNMKKTVCLDDRAKREIGKFPLAAQIKTTALLQALERDGFLHEPYAKKLNDDLFEIRIKSKGQWRVLYAYLLQTEILILSAFHKKTQKTPISELTKAKQRLKEYQ
jgi:phage-related protein